MKWILLIFCLTVLFAAYQNCTNNNSSGIPEFVNISNINSHGLKLFVNGVDTPLQQPLTVRVGDSIRLEGDLRSSRSLRSKFTLYNDCVFSEVIQDWSNRLQQNLEYTVQAKDVGPCTTINIWVRAGTSDDPWPGPFDRQESLLLNVVRN